MEEAIRAAMEADVQQKRADFEELTRLDMELALAKKEEQQLLETEAQLLREITEKEKAKAARQATEEASAVEMLNAFVARFEDLQRRYARLQQELVKSDAESVAARAHRENRRSRVATVATQMKELGAKLQNVREEAASAFEACRLRAQQATKSFKTEKEEAGASLRELLNKTNLEATIARFKESKTAVEVSLVEEATLEHQLRELRSVNSFLRSEKGEAHVQAQELRARIDEEKSEYELWKQHNSEIEAEIAVLVKEVCQAEEETHSLQTSNEINIEKARVLNDRLPGLLAAEDEHRQKNFQQQTLEEQLAKLKTEKQTLLDERSQLATSLTSLAMARDAAESKSHDRLTALIRLRSRLAQRQQKQAVFEQKIAARKEQDRRDKEAKEAEAKKRKHERKREKEKAKRQAAEEARLRAEEEQRLEKERVEAEKMRKLEEERRQAQERLEKEAEEERKKEAEEEKRKKEQSEKEKHRRDASLKRRRQAEERRAQEERRKQEEEKERLLLELEKAEAKKAMERARLEREKSSFHTQAKPLPSTKPSAPTSTIKTFSQNQLLLKLQGDESDGDETDVGEFDPFNNSPPIAPKPQSEASSEAFEETLVWNDAQIATSTPLQAPKPVRGRGGAASSKRGGRGRGRGAARGGRGGRGRGRQAKLPTVSEQANDTFDQLFD